MCFAGMVSVEESSCQDLLAAADLLGLTDVVEACCEFLKEQLHPSNAIGNAIQSFFFVSHYLDRGKPNRQAGKKKRTEKERWISLGKLKLF